MNTTRRFKGFTIIELIVVVVIISVLAAIILANVNSYNISSKDTAAKADMRSLIIAGTKFFDTHGTYSGFTNSTDWNNVVSALRKANYNDPLGNFDPDTQTWCAYITLKAPGSGLYCVDSSGANKQEMHSDGLCSYGSSPSLCP